MTIRGFFQRIKDRKTVAERIRTGESQKVANAGHYQHIHETFVPYQENNWLVDDLPLLTKITTGSVCEIGCGNGRFLNAAAAHYEQLMGVDWAYSPLMVVLPEKVRFQEADLSAGFPIAEKFDLLCSADFLEHLTYEAVGRLIGQIIPAAKYHYHKIACYDDGGSHLTILSPSEWLRIFRKYDKSFYLHRVNDRRNNGQDVAVITNYKNLPKS